MSVAAIALCAAALLILPRRSLKSGSASRQTNQSGAKKQRVPAIRMIIVALLGSATALAIGGGGGVVVGGLVAGATYLLLSRSAKAHSVTQRRWRLAQVPLTLEVAAMLLRAGATPSGSLNDAAQAVGPFLTEDIGVVVRLQEMGQDSRSAWAVLATDPVLAPVAQSAIRSTGSGSALAADWERVAADCRQQHRAAAHAAAQRAGIFALAPLGLCFLPAFICLGVLPIVVGLASDVFGQ